MANYFSPEQQAAIRKAAKGPQQDMLAGYLIRDGQVQNYAKKSVNWKCRYNAAFQNFYRRLLKAGIALEQTPGPLGGQYSCWISKKEEDNV